MNKKVLQNKAFLMSHAVDRKKMYKSGKQWIIGSALIFAMIGIGDAANHQSASANKIQAVSTSPSTIAQKGSALANKINPPSNQSSTGENHNKPKVGLISQEPSPNGSTTKKATGQSAKPESRQESANTNNQNNNAVPVGGHKAHYLNTIILEYDLHNGTEINKGKDNVNFQRNIDVNLGSDGNLFNNKSDNVTGYLYNKTPNTLSPRNFSIGDLTTTSDKRISSDLDPSEKLFRGRKSDITISQTYVQHYIANKATNPITVNYSDQYGHHVTSAKVSGSLYQSGSDITKLASYPKSDYIVDKNQNLAYDFGPNNKFTPNFNIKLTGNATTTDPLVQINVNKDGQTSHPSVDIKGKRVGDSFTITPNDSQLGTEGYSASDPNQAIQGVVTNVHGGYKLTNYQNIPTLNYTKDYPYATRNASAVADENKANAISSQFNNYLATAKDKKDQADDYATVANDYSDASDIRTQAQNDDKSYSDVSGYANKINSLASVISNDVAQVATGSNAKNSSQVSDNLNDANTALGQLQQSAQATSPNAQADVNQMQDKHGGQNYFNRVVFETSDGNDVGVEFDYYGTPGTKIPYQNHVPQGYILKNPTQTFKITKNTSDVNAFVAKVDLDKSKGSNIPLTKNPADFWTTIDLHFIDNKNGKSSDRFLYSNNQGVLGDNIDLLNNTGYQPKPGNKNINLSDFSNKVIRGINTSYFNSPTVADNGSYYSDVSASDTNNNYGATKLNPRHITLNFTSKSDTDPIHGTDMTDNIEYITSDGKVLKQQPISGVPGKLFHLTNSNTKNSDEVQASLPSGYQLVSDGTALHYDGFTHNVEITGNPVGKSTKDSSIKLVFQRKYNGTIILSDTTSQTEDLSSQQIGNTVTYNPNNYVPSDYNATNSDQITNVQINPSDLSSNSSNFSNKNGQYIITFTYNYDTAKANADPKNQQNDKITINYLNQNGENVGTKTIQAPKGASGTIPTSDMPSDYTYTKPSDKQNGVKYTGTGEPQTIDIPVTGSIQAKDLTGNGSSKNNNPNSIKNNTGNPYHKDANTPNDPWNPSDANSPFNTNNNNSPFNTDKKDDNDPLNPNDPKSPLNKNNNPDLNPNDNHSQLNPNYSDSILNPKNPKSPLDPANSTSPFKGYTKPNDLNNPQNPKSKWNPNNPDSPFNPRNPYSPYNPANLINDSSDSNLGDVRITIELQNKNGVTKTYHKVANEGNLTVGDTFMIMPSDPNYNPAGYSPADHKPITGVITKDGAQVDGGTSVFIYNANQQQAIPVTIKDQNGNPIASNITGPTNSKLTNNELPYGYQLPSDTNYYFNGQGQLIDGNNHNQPVSNIKIQGDPINGQAQVILRYNVYNPSGTSIVRTDYKIASDAQTRFSGRVGDTHIINPVVYAKSGYTIPSDYVLTFTPHDINPSDSEGSQYKPVIVFDYNAREVGPVNVSYVDANTNQPINNGQTYPLPSDFDNLIVGTKVNLAQKSNEPVSDLNTGNINNVNYVLTPPKGYHLTHAINEVTLAPNASGTVTRSTHGLTLTLGLFRSIKPNNTHHNSNVQPAKPVVHDSTITVDFVNSANKPKHHITISKTLTNKVGTKFNLADFMKEYNTPNGYQILKDVNAFTNNNRTAVVLINPSANSHNSTNTEPANSSTTNSKNSNNTHNTVLPQPTNITPVRPIILPNNSTKNNPVNTGVTPKPTSNTTQNNNSSVSSSKTTNNSPVISEPTNSTNNNSDINITPSSDTNHNAKSSSISTPKKNANISDLATKTDSDIPATNNNITKATNNRNTPTGATNISSDNPVAPTVASDSAETPTTPITFGSSEPGNNLATTPSVENNSTNNNTTSKLPQTNEANSYVGIMTLVTSILGLGLAGIDVDKKHYLK